MTKIFVTGAGRGLGQAIYKELAHDWDAVPVYRSVCNVDDPESVRAYFRQFSADTDVWALVHCAGIARMELTCSTHTDHMKAIIGTNLLGTMYANKYFGQLLVRRKAGRIINFSSIAVPLAIKGEAIYAASKAGVETFSRAFAREMAPFNVAVNCIAPGPVDTDMTGQIAADKLQRVVEQQIVPRKATVEEVAQTVRWLLAEPSGMVTGQVINLGGV